ncbi:MAG: HEAT repeat domain-containing protein, partial [Gemmatimonadaceae bacterium]|nr:HEAT repeat domain-containing protein [Gemmatimonadaceae bacterium]
MDHSVTFARHFARLVWLLLHEPANVDEQKATLRALVTISRDGGVVLTAEGETLTANGNVLPDALADVADVANVANQMLSHGLVSIQIDVRAAPADMLGAARILAGVPMLGDGGAAAEGKRQALGATTVLFTKRGVPVPEPTAMPNLEFGEMVDDPIAAAEATSRRAPRPSKPTTAPADARGEAAGGMFEQFAAARVPTSSAEQLLAQLDQTTGASVLVSVLDDLVSLAEHAARDGKPALVTEILHRIGRREPDVQDFESKRAFVMALRRLAKPTLLRAVAMQLPHRPEQRGELVAVLGRAGEDGADALIEQISAVQGQADRRVFFDALLQLQSGIPTLIHMLGDARWFVARNAADLLGEMQAREAEQPLVSLLQHDDDRVRRAATGALMRLDTPRATQAIQDALKDGSPQMRIDAAGA